MNIHQNGYWTGLEAEKYHIFDAKLARALVCFLMREKCITVGDFGCGMGEYVKAFKDAGIYAIGYDGNPSTPTLTNRQCLVLDLSIPNKLNPSFDWILSLEVGEHIPPEFEDIFLANLHANNKRGIILSWALEGQGGDGHVNERSNEYIKSKIMSMGYTNDIDSEIVLRSEASLHWFQKTIMVFRRRI